jgi:hypothetical protein
MTKKPSRERRFFGFRFGFLVSDEKNNKKAPKFGAMTLNNHGRVQEL